MVSAMPKITFLDNGQTYDAPEGGSYLELCQSLGIPHDFGCTVGSCGTCRCQVVEGTDHVSEMSDEERETIEMVTNVEGARLGCQLQITGDVSIRSVD